MIGGSFFFSSRHGGVASLKGWIEFSLEMMLSFGICTAGELGGLGLLCLGGLLLLGLLLALLQLGDLLCADRLGLDLVVLCLPLCRLLILLLLLVLLFLLFLLLGVTITVRPPSAWRPSL